MIDLNKFACEDGIFIISPPQLFHGGEEAYELAVVNPDEKALRQGHGAMALIRSIAARPLGSFLEIGAGSGACSLGLISAASTASALITDTSKRFLQMIPPKLAAHGITSKCNFATLSDEDMGRIADDAFDAIVISSAVHHFADWRLFVREAYRILRVGGVLAIQEPMREGNLLMATILDAALSSQRPDLQLLDSEDREKLRRVRDFIYIVADSSISKIGEDKHNFLADDLFEAGLDAGFKYARLYRNIHFGGLTLPGALERRTHPISLLAYLTAFLRDHHGFSSNGLAVLERSLFPEYAMLDALYLNGDGAPLVGVMAFRA